MGIHDRDYVRQSPGGLGAPGGMGFARPRRFSVNTWLIIINVAVFLLDAMLWSQAVVIPVEIGRVFDADTTAEQRERAQPVIEGETGEPVTRPARGMSLATDVTPLVDPQTGQQVGVERYAEMPPLQGFFHFSTAKGFFQLQVWRLITFQFLHGGMWHLLMNMVALFFFGGLIESHLGGKRYLAFYLACGVFGGVVYLALNVLGQIVTLPGVLFNDIYTPLIGASAGVFGVLMAAAFIAPNVTVLLMFFLPMRMATVAYLFLAFAAFNLLVGGSNAGGDAAHVGGALAGAYFIRHPHLLSDFFDIFGSLGDSKKGRRRKKPKGRARGGTGKVGKAVKTAFGKGSAQPDEQEVDRVLAKVATQGLHSLTEAEKRVLRQATESRRQ